MSVHAVCLCLCLSVSVSVCVCVLHLSLLLQYTLQYHTIPTRLLSKIKLSAVFSSARGDQSVSLSVSLSSDCFQMAISPAVFL